MNKFIINMPLDVWAAFCIIIVALILTLIGLISVFLGVNPVAAFGVFAVVFSLVHFTKWLITEYIL
jgi:DMSO/TMAO reductase YedYZ heme-binding membrane subunit